MKDKEIKIKVKNNKIITLEQLFENKQQTRKKMANMSFDKKINMLISLQEIAHKWGNMKNVLVWRL